MELPHKELTGAIIGAYYEVYNYTSRTHPEYIYERAMIEELRRRGYPTIRQDEYRIFYRERLVGLQRLVCSSCRNRRYTSFSVSTGSPSDLTPGPSPTRRGEKDARPQISAGV